MFTNACRSWPKSATTSGTAARSRSSSMPVRRELVLRRARAPRRAARAGRAARGCIGRSRAKSSRFRTIAEQRWVSRSMSARFRWSAARRASSGGPSASVRETSFAKVRMPASGLLISWAIEAESLPSEESFSVRTSCSCASRRSAVRDSTSLLEPGDHARAARPRAGGATRVISLKERASSPSSPRRVDADLDVEVVARDAARPLEERGDRLDHLGAAEQVEERGHARARRAARTATKPRRNASTFASSVRERDPHLHEPEHLPPGRVDVARRRGALARVVDRARSSRGSARRPAPRISARSLAGARERGCARPPWHARAGAPLLADDLADVAAGSVEKTTRPRLSSTRTRSIPSSAPTRSRFAYACAGARRRASPRCALVWIASPSSAVERASWSTRSACIRRSANQSPASAASARTALMPRSFVESRCRNGTATRTSWTGEAARASPALPRRRRSAPARPRIVPAPRRRRSGRRRLARTMRPARRRRLARRSTASVGRIAALRARAQPRPDPAARGSGRARAGRAPRAGRARPRSRARRRGSAAAPSAPACASSARRSRASRANTSRWTRSAIAAAAAAPIASRTRNVWRSPARSAAWWRVKSWRTNSPPTLRPAASRTGKMPRT